MAPREGSKKANVYAFFQQNTPDDTVAFGVGLGLKLGTVKSWIGAWGKGGTKAEAPDKVKGPRQHAFDKRKRVCLTYDADSIGILVTEGEQVSEVKFAYGSRFIPNNLLKQV